MLSKTETYIKDCLRELDRPEIPSLIAGFEFSSEIHSEQEAYKCLGKSVTYAEVAALSRDFAAFLLQKCGLSKGDRIAIQLPNLVQYPIVAWGALRAGLVIVNTNPLYTKRELVYQFNDSGAKALVSLSDNLPILEDVVPETGIETVIATNAIDMRDPQPLPKSKLRSAVSLPDALAKGRELELPEVNLTLDDIALLQYTGGTTGAPKGAVLSHGNLFSAVLMSPRSFGADMTELEVSIAPMPLYHIYGFAVTLIGGYLNGSFSILIPNPRDLDGLINVMKAEPFTSFAGVNTLFASLMHHPEFDNVDFSHLRWTIGGGAATVPEIAEEWKRRTGANIHEGYGLSETAAMATVNTLTSRELGTIGPPMIGSEFKVVDKDGNELPVGQEGELCIRGPQVMQGYWQREEATAEVIDAEGWFRTGDIAIIQQNGHIRIVDRVKDMVLVSGFNVYPNEIENVVFTHPDIVECAVIGVPDEKTGEAVKVFAVTKNKNLDADKLRRFCREELTAYKVPKYVEFVDELPKSAVGKILRRELRDH
ncbi:MAG: AMP-binding protein [Gammaproteobacteria bacterium]|nr:AMP-binding protein [Gammaproteobacteria bacterium]MDH3434967.1 AMP-binding protein [Gammaproteobacteria bacterium]